MTYKDEALEIAVAQAEDEPCSNCGCKEKEDGTGTCMNCGQTPE